MVEAEGVHHLMTFAEMTGAHVYIVHTSCEEALARSDDAGRQRGVNVWVETLIQYLLLDRTYAEKPNFEGAKYVMSPPLRDKKNQEVIWNASAPMVRSPRWRPITRRSISDPEADGQRRFHQNSQRHSVARGSRQSVLHPRRENGTDRSAAFVDAASTQAAKLFGLFPRKGAIQVGSDADLVVYDPDYRGTISAKTQQMNVDYSAFEGWEIEGRPHVVTVRGKVAARDGKFVGELGRGKLLKREPTHF